MGATRRRFTLEFKTEAAHRVIDSGRSVAEVARELSIGQEALYRWVRDERRRLEAASASGDEPLTPAERQELIRLRRELAELRKDNEFLGKVAAYFAAKPPSKKDLR
ncbi:MAG: transposase [Actinomycetota bacterium]|nr:transposase [Actinomycetota bacterium]